MKRFFPKARRSVPAVTVTAVENTEAPVTTSNDSMSFAELCVIVDKFPNIVNSILNPELRDRVIMHMISVNPNFITNVRERNQTKPMVDAALKDNPDIDLYYIDKSLLSNDYIMAIQKARPKRIYGRYLSSESYDEWLYMCKINSKNFEYAPKIYRCCVNDISYTALSDTPSLIGCTHNGGLIPYDMAVIVLDIDVKKLKFLEAKSQSDDIVKYAISKNINDALPYIKIWNENVFAYAYSISPSAALKYGDTDAISCYVESKTK